MFEREDMTKVIIIRAIILSAIISILLFVFFRTNSYKYILGLILGTVISILSFKQIEFTVNKAIYMNPDRAKNYSTRNYILRYLIYFIVLLFTIKIRYFDFLATFVGFTMIKMVIVISAFWEQIRG